MIIDTLIPPEVQKILGAAKARDLNGFVLTIEALGASTSPARITFDSDGAVDASIVFVAHARKPTAERLAHASCGASTPREAILQLVREVREAHMTRSASIPWRRCCTCTNNCTQLRRQDARAMPKQKRESPCVVKTAEICHAQTVRVGSIPQNRAPVQTVPEPRLRSHELICRLEKRPWMLANWRCS